MLAVVYSRMFVDLEHELDHIEQIFSRFISQGIPLFTKVWEQQPNKQWQEKPDHPDSLRNWQNSIIEYHVRLLEFRRLFSRNVPKEILEAHADQLMVWAKRYNTAIGIGKSQSKKVWVEQYFPDLPHLIVEAKTLIQQLHLTK